MSPLDTASRVIGEAAWRELDPRTAYAILRLRTAVFVVEQHCPYQDMDGLDLEPEVRQLWVTVAGEVVSTLRTIQRDDDTWRIGRVATHPDFRGQGHAAALMHRALHLVGRPVQLNAQAHLAGWYAGFSFRVSGEGWTEDGIPHVPMSLE